MSSASKLKNSIRRLNRQRINGMRNFLLNVVIYLFDSKKNHLKEVVADAPILVLRSDGKIGDSIVATGFFRELKKNSPQSKIMVIGNPQVLSILKNLDYVDEVILYKKGLVSTLKILWKLKKMHFKFFLNSTDEIKPHAAFIQGQVKAGEKFVFNTERLKSTTQVIKLQEEQTHFSCLYENTLKVMFPNNTFDISYELKLAPAVISKVQKIISSKVKEGKNIIAYNSFGGTRLRSFTIDTSIKIIKSLLTNPLNVVISLASQQDVKMVQIARSKASHEFSSEEMCRWIVLEDVKTLEESFGVIAVSDLLITPDTSLVHAACALNKKIVAVYRQRGGYQHSKPWGPRCHDSSRAKVIHAVSNSPTVWDVNFVKVEEVVEAVDELLEITERSILPMSEYV